ncbi:MAG: N-acetyl sugar amidotransferase [Alphaproteobacteria bacterium]
MTQTICQRCVMDTTDPNIVFFGAEGCNHCIAATARLAQDVPPDAKASAQLAEHVAWIKARAKGKRYDVLLGISGGADSSVLAVEAIRLGLRPLAVHVDNGWNSDLAVSNIANLLEKLKIDLVTNVLQWNEIRDMQRAYLKAGVVDIECVADHAIIATLYKTAAKYGIPTILAGTNVRTESILPRAWVHDKRDGRNVRAIHRQFGTVTLNHYPFLSPCELLSAIFIRKIRFVPLLNYLNYDKEAAVTKLQSDYGWRPYARKHGESRFTRFFQEYILPTRWGIDKRKAHLSSLIVSGAMTRAQALEALQTPLYAPQEQESDIEYICKKLGFTRAEFDALMAQPKASHRDFANNAWMFDMNNPITLMIRKWARGGT